MVCRQIWQRTTGRWVTVTGKRVAAEFFIGPYYARSMELGWCLLGDEVRPERGMSVFCGRAGPDQDVQTQAVHPEPLERLKIVTRTCDTQVPRRQRLHRSIIADSTSRTAMSAASRENV